MNKKLRAEIEEAINNAQTFMDKDGKPKAILFAPIQVDAILEEIEVFVDKAFYDAVGEDLTGLLHFHEEAECDGCMVLGFNKRGKQIKEIWED